MKNTKAIITVSTREATLKKRFRRHLKSLGFQKDDDGALIPPGTGKEVVRTIHGAQRNDRLAASQSFISENHPKLLVGGQFVTQAHLELAVAELRKNDRLAKEN